MEKLMQFVWAHRLWDTSPMVTADGRRVRIINPGVLNENAGPDFFNASIQIGDQRWYGNIEIHVRASDWYRHGHQNDHAYDSVILHVVQVADAEVRRPDGSVIPQITVKCTPEAAARCNTLMLSSQGSLPCYDTIRSIPSIYHTEWLTALAFERLYNKSQRIIDLLKITDGDWEAAAYITLARALGFGLNAEPFETLAKNLPLKFLNRHRDSLIITEALIFGQAGMIPEPTEGEDTYITEIRREYEFMARKFTLHRPPIVWKLSRTRPQNFPHRRLALLAMKIHTGFAIIARLDDLTTALQIRREQSFHDTRIYYPHIAGPETSETPSIEEIRREFDIHLQGYWATHYTFSGTSANSPRALSRSSLDRLLINVAIPLMMARATVRGDVALINAIPETLRQFAAEDNRDVRLFTQAGIACRDAFDSQALIELRREYCEKHKCLFCRFGHRMLSREIVR